MRSTNLSAAALFTHELIDNLPCALQFHYLTTSLFPRNSYLSYWKTANNCTRDLSLNLHNREPALSKLMRLNSHRLAWFNISSLSLSRNKNCEPGERIDKNTFIRYGFYLSIFRNVREREREYTLNIMSFEHHFSSFRNVYVSCVFLQRKIQQKCVYTWYFFHNF